MHSTDSAGASQGSLLHQPKSVWAVAFASVIAFMGIGLVDPILPTLRARTSAPPRRRSRCCSPATCSSWALAMLVSGWVSSRHRAEAHPAGRPGHGGRVQRRRRACPARIGEIVGFRAGWGLGNALFVGTALAVIVGAASGGIDGAIILYESALGIGIADRPAGRRTAR